MGKVLTWWRPSSSRSAQLLPTWPSWLGWPSTAAFVWCGLRTCGSGRKMAAMARSWLWMAVKSMKMGHCPRSGLNWWITATKMLPPPSLKESWTFARTFLASPLSLHTPPPTSPPDVATTSSTSLGTTCRPSACWVRAMRCPEFMYILPSKPHLTDKLHIPHMSLDLFNLLILPSPGKGHYGDVFLAKAHGIRDGEPETLVVVKSLLTRDESHHFEFRREMELFSKLSHENIVKLLGVCREMEPQFLITEYCEWVSHHLPTYIRSRLTFDLRPSQGDLKQFLWATRVEHGGQPRAPKLPPLTIAQKVGMCQQVALAMEHLAQQRLVHRDLATRNVLLSSTLDLKVTSLGLCRDIYASEYFPFHQQLIPLRWMPPEAVLDDDFSTKSDVWSYGVFVWEIFSLADLPYQGRSDDEVLRGLKTHDNHLAPIPSCPEKLLAIIPQCMAPIPSDRPSFAQIASAVGEMNVDSRVWRGSIYLWRKDNLISWGNILAFVLLVFFVNGRFFYEISAALRSRGSLHVMPGSALGISQYPVEWSSFKQSSWMCTMQGSQQSSVQPCYMIKKHLAETDHCHRSLKSTFISAHHSELQITRKSRAIGFNIAQLSKSLHCHEGSWCVCVCSDVLSQECLFACLFITCVLVFCK